jgi:hypothetical protein
MIFPLTPQSKIYMCCPALSYTGGPDAMHQLVDTMRRCGLNAYMHYQPSIPDPTRLEFATYNAPYAKTIEDQPENVMIVPEVMTLELRKYRAINKAIWWLSAINHLKMKVEKRFDWEVDASESLVHFAQSCFAEHFLRDQGVRNPVMLIEYLHARYMVRILTPKKNQVAYFAKKNAGVIEALMQTAPDIQWVPILSPQEMTPLQVRQLLSESKVYVDFGPHPGRDRIPREAAVQHCCVIIGNRGAAAYEGDYPFDAKYKFEQFHGEKGFGIQDISRVVSLIRTCFDQYEQIEKDFDGYRSWIQQHQQMQRQQIVSYFGRNEDRCWNPEWIKTRNVTRFYLNKVMKKLSGYRYPEEED